MVFITNWWHSIAKQFGIGQRRSVLCISNGNYCESQQRVAITFTRKTTPAPTNIPSPFIVCEDRPIGNLMANINWYYTPTGGAKIPINTPLVDGATYYASQIGECGESVSRSEIVITLRATPPPVSLFNEI